MAAGSVSAVFVRRILAAAIARGAEPRALTAAVGIDPETLRDPDARVPHAVVLALWSEAERATGDEAFGAHLAEMIAASPNNVMGYAAHSSPSLGAALRRMARYGRLLHDTFSIELGHHGEMARLELKQRHALGAHRHGLEFGMAMTCLFARRNLESGFVPDSVSFRHPGAARRALEDIFQARVKFGAGADVMTFARARLDEPFAQADPQLCSQLDRHMDELVARQLSSSNLDERARGAISEQLREGAPSVEAVAARLRMSPRTLQRRLRDDGTSFQALVVEVRRELALRYLKEADLSVAEVAYHVGFSDVAAFHHAFKRWTGQTPVEARRSVKSAGIGG